MIEKYCKYKHKSNLNIKMKHQHRLLSIKLTPFYKALCNPLL